MLKIAVCVKQVPVQQADQCEKDGTINRQRIPVCMNMYDYAALEIALKIKETEGAMVDVITMGPANAIGILKESLALGADEAILLCDSSFAGADVLATAYTLSKGIMCAGTYDIILCGQKTTDGDTAQVGPELAYQLGITYIPSVCKVPEVKDGKLYTAFITDHKYIELAVSLPALLSVEPSISKVRVPSLTQRIKSQKKKVYSWNAKQIQADPKRIGQTGSATSVIGITKVVKNRKCQFIEMKPAEALTYIEGRKKLWTK